MNFSCTYTFLSLVINPYALHLALRQSRMADILLEVVELNLVILPMRIRTLNLTLTRLYSNSHFSSPYG